MPRSADSVSLSSHGRQLADLEVKVSNMAGLPQEDRTRSYWYVVDCAAATKTSRPSEVTPDGTVEWKQVLRFRNTVPGEDVVTITILYSDAAGNPQPYLSGSIVFTLPGVSRKTMTGAAHKYRVASQQGDQVSVKVVLRLGAVDDTVSTHSRSSIQGLTRNTSPGLWQNVPRIGEVAPSRASQAHSVRSSATSVRQPVEPVRLSEEMESWVKEVSAGPRPFLVDWHPWELYSLFRHFTRTQARREKFDIMDLKEYTGKAPCYYNCNGTQWFEASLGGHDPSHEEEDRRFHDSGSLRLNNKPGYKGYNLDCIYGEGVVLGHGCPVCTFVHAPEELQGPEWAQERLKKPPPAGEWWKFGHWPPKKTTKLFQKIMDKVLAARGHRPHPCGDKAMTPFEFCKACFKIMGEYKPPTSGPEVRTGPLLQAHLVFKAFDFDDSGYLDETELKRVFRAMGGDDADTAAEEVEMLFDKLMDESNQRLLGGPGVRLEVDGCPVLTKRVLANVLCEAAERPNSGFAFFSTNIAHITTYRLMNPVNGCLEGLTTLPCMPSRNPIDGHPSCSPFSWTCCVRSMPPFTELPPGKSIVPSPQDLFILFLAFQASGIDSELSMDDFLEFLDESSVVVKDSQLTPHDLRSLHISSRVVTRIERNGEIEIDLQTAWRRRPLSKGEKMRCWMGTCTDVPFDERGCLVENEDLPLVCTVCKDEGARVACRLLLSGDVPEGDEHVALCKRCYQEEKMYAMPDRIKAEGLFNTLDDAGDKNGMLSSNELLCGVLEALGKLQTAGDSEAMRKAAGDMFVKVFFLYHDSDKSGTLSMLELREMLKHLISNYNYYEEKQLEEAADKKVRELMDDANTAFKEFVEEYRLHNNNSDPPGFNVSQRCLEDDMLNEDVLRLVLQYQP
eukprot:Sspe_Gene.17263::Locus_6126_Transcript_2_2_Confidence_0.750_Length_2771::g.17263::m.17263